MNLNEALLKYSTSFRVILKSINTYEQLSIDELEIISMLINKEYRDYDPLFGTNINLLETGEIQYDRPTKVKNEIVYKKVTASLERFITRLLKDITKNNYSASTIEKLCGKIKKTYLTDLKVCLVTGEAINWVYNENNGDVVSCMSDKYNTANLELWVTNPDKVACLILTRRERVVARALVFNTDDKIVTYEKTYYRNNEFKFFLEDYIENTELRKKVILKSDFTEKIGTNLDVIDDWSNLITKDWSRAENEEITLDVSDITYMPYIDTYSNIDFIDSWTIKLHTEEDITLYPKAKCTDGQIHAKCPECNGIGNIDCWKCEGTEEIVCETCEGKGEQECSKCNGEGETTKECPDCDGRGEIECALCDGTGDNDGEKCSLCNATGMQKCDCDEGNITSTCNKCEGICTVECPDCDGSGMYNCYEPSCENGRTACEDCGGSGLEDMYLDRAKRIYK